MSTWILVLCLANVRGTSCVKVDEYWSFDACQQAATDTKQVRENRYYSNGIDALCVRSPRGLK